MLADVCTSLAKQVARDGEGATKLVEVRVKGHRRPRAGGAHDRGLAAREDRDVRVRPQLGPGAHGGGPQRRVALRAEDAVLAFVAGGERHVLFERGTPTTDRSRPASRRR